MGSLRYTKHILTSDQSTHINDCMGASFTGSQGEWKVPNYDGMTLCCHSN